MRQFKFRVWDKSKNKLSLVKSISYADDGYAETVIVEPAPKLDYYNGLVNGENGVLQQFTGLLDINGKEIYEGDIIKYEFPEKGRNQVTVRWSYENEDNHPGFRLFDEYGQYGNRKIIGNIFENPELIEKK